MIEKLKNWWTSVMPSIGLAPVVEEFINSQEPLGAEFEKVLNDNLWELLDDH